MLLGEVGTHAQWLVNCALRDDPIWTRPAAEVDEQELQRFYRRAGRRGMRQVGLEAIDRLQSAAILTAIENQHAGQELSAVILHVPPEEPWLLDEFIAGLRKLTEVQRQACLWALESGSEPTVAMQLKWTDVRQTVQNTMLAQEVIDVARQHRHIRLPYVFWQWATARIATPLLHLDTNLYAAFGMHWPRLTRRYRFITRVDRHAEHQAFLQTIQGG